MDREPTFTRRALVRSAVAAAAVGPAGLLDGAERAFAAAGRDQVQHFVSRPDLRPPMLAVRHHGPIASGELFIAPSSGPGQRGAMIVDASGQVVWFHPTVPRTAMNFRAATYRRKPVLTWWEGKSSNGLGTGTHVILDDSYRVVARVPAGRGRQSDLHEFLITPDDTALLTSYELRTMDLRPAGGPSSGPAIGGVVQEIALPSGRVLFEWRSLDHVAIDETHARWTGHPLDYFHVNSVGLTADGNLLVSARNTWAVYKVSRKTGNVQWRLGGRRSDFHMGPGAVFAWQHDAREHGENRVTIFDDGALPQVEPQSRGLLIELDPQHRTARLVGRWVHRPNRIVSRFMGNLQQLDNGNVLVGWGSEPYVTEFGPAGDIRFEARLPRGGQNYRAFRFPWRGHPTLPPAAVYRYSYKQHHGTVYASWNGATEVAAWQLESGPVGTALSAGPTVPRRGFEAALAVPFGHKVGRAVALDKSGHVLGRSRTIRV
jgi:Arylsulfotransferase (ASST)